MQLLKQKAKQQQKARRCRKAIDAGSVNQLNKKKNFFNLIHQRLHRKDSCLIINKPSKLAGSAIKRANVCVNFALYIIIKSAQSFSKNAQTFASSFSNLIPYFQSATKNFTQLNLINQLKNYDEK